MKKSGLLMLLLFISCYICAQDKEFPSKWLGAWNGKMLMLRTAQANADTVDLLFEFLESGKPKCWTYRMTYNSPKYGKIVKGYELLKPDTIPASMFLLDEKDGIRIEMVKMGDCIYSNFSVAGQYLTSVMRKEQDAIFYEIVAAKEKPSFTSNNHAGENEETFTVQSFPPFTCQFARLFMKK